MRRYPDLANRILALPRLLRMRTSQRRIRAVAEVTAFLPLGSCTRPNVAFVADLPSRSFFLFFFFFLFPTDPPPMRRR